MSRRLPVLALVCGLAGVGCFRTQYVNLQPPGRVAHHLPDHSEPLRRTIAVEYSSMGTVPEKRRLAVGPACEGTAHVESVETGRSAAQSLAALFPIVPLVYAPYSVNVVCDHGQGFALSPRGRDAIPTEFALHREYAAPYEDVWRAAVAALASFDLALTRADRSAGVLIVPRFELDESHFHRVSLGHTRGMPHKLLRQEARLVMSIQPTARGGARVDLDVAMRLRIRTGNRDHYIAARYEWREVRSNLTLENAILDRIGMELDDIAAARRAGS